MVSVRKGSNSGFGFTIYPGNGETKDLDENHVIVGQVLEGLDVIETLNNLPVVTSTKVRQRTGRNISVLRLLILRLLCILRSKIQNSEKDHRELVDMVEHNSIAMSSSPCKN